MIKLERINVFNLEGALRGMRNPMASWPKSDSGFVDINHLQIQWKIGLNDLALAQKLISSGSDHSKFLRQIMISMDITAPLYWWKEMDTYKVGTTANSESTMHRLAATPITTDCFSFDAVLEHYECLECNANDASLGELLVGILENYRLRYLETNEKRYWRALIQLLPCAWNQMRTWTADYAVLRNIYTSRRGHKLSEWRTFCEEIEKLPYAKELIIFGVDKSE